MDSVVNILHWQIQQWVPKKDLKSLIVPQDAAF